MRRKKSQASLNLTWHEAKELPWTNIGRSFKSHKPATNGVLKSRWAAVFGKAICESRPSHTNALIQGDNAPEFQNNYLSNAKDSASTVNLVATTLVTTLRSANDEPYGTLYIQSPSVPAWSRTPLPLNRFRLQILSFTCPWTMRDLTTSN
jgi:hypothetical protein